MCETPDAAVVAISEKWIVADTMAGAKPSDNKIDDDVTPKPMPREPSTNCAKNPTKAIINSFFIVFAPFFQ
ncbi:hypothetical protein HMPREF3215_01705 [Staphylococcus simulans]|nr:hypothetical protein HMPREF3215_01705 [Staphylococcus simulans]